MKILLLIATVVVIAAGKLVEPDLPLCPTNVQYLPQKLPMHCKMPANAAPPPFPGMMNPFVPFMFSGPPPNMSMPVPRPPQMPPMPQPPMPQPPMPQPPMPGPSPFPEGMKMPMQMPMPMPMPMPMAMPMAPPPPKLPVIVMPVYTPEKQTTDKADADCTDSSSEEHRSREYRGRHRSRKGRRMGIMKRTHISHRLPDRVLTPVLQYVTNEGYVLFEKQLSKADAKDWLQLDKSKRDPNFETRNAQEIGELKEKLHNQVRDDDDAGDDSKAAEPVENTKTNNKKRRTRLRKGRNN